MTFWLPAFVIVRSNFGACLFFAFCFLRILVEDIGCLSETAQFSSARRMFNTSFFAVLFGICPFVSEAILSGLISE